MIYSDAGNILVKTKSGKVVMVGYSCLEEDDTEVREEKINLDDITIDGDLIRYAYGSGDIIVQLYNNNLDYSGWKSTIVKWRYSYDDQIAIMLNNGKDEESVVVYDRMQEWRDWASTLAGKIIEAKDTLEHQDAQ